MKNFKAKIMYESKGKTPDGNSFLTVKEARGYYQYAERGGIDSIAFVLWDSKQEKFGLIYESKPPMDEVWQDEVRMTTAFGGSVDVDMAPLGICQKEVKEESGFVVTPDRIKSVGPTLVSTQMNQLAYGFLVDVTGIPKTEVTEAEAEITDEQNNKDPNEFSGNEVRWFSYDKIMENNDWKSIWIITKADYLDYI